MINSAQDTGHSAGMDNEAILTGPWNIHTSSVNINILRDRLDHILRELIPFLGRTVKTFMIEEVLQTIFSNLPTPDSFAVK